MSDVVCQIVLLLLYRTKMMRTVEIAFVIILLLVGFCQCFNSTQAKRHWDPVHDKFTNLKDKEQCGGWGEKIVTYKQYKKLKNSCYLTLRQKILCCLEKPDCPENYKPKIPIKPYHLFPIHRLEISCVPMDERERLFGVVDEEGDEMGKKKKESYI